MNHLKNQTDGYESPNCFADKKLCDDFLQRIIESEQVWVQKVDGRIKIKNTPKRKIVAVWPQRQLAIKSAEVEKGSCRLFSFSLDEFMDEVLGEFMIDDLVLEIMPTSNKPGYLATPHHIYSVLDYMIEQESLLAV